jgi:transcription elongation GreA/GreB family factor
MASLKQQLYDLCVLYVKTRIQEAELAITDTQEAVANETKSSAGDKYETSREMMQQDINRDTARLYEARKLKAALDTINPNLKSAIVQPGSLVRTSVGNYYLAISAGKLHAGQEIFQVVSAATPIGLKMVGLSAGDSFELNGKTYLIQEIA